MQSDHVNRLLIQLQTRVDTSLWKREGEAQETAPEEQKSAHTAAVRRLSSMFVYPLNGRPNENSMHSDGSVLVGLTNLVSVVHYAVCVLHLSHKDLLKSVSVRPQLSQ